MDIYFYESKKKESEISEGSKYDRLFRNSLVDLLVSRILMAPFRLLIPVWDIVGKFWSSYPPKSDHWKMVITHRTSGRSVLCDTVLLKSINAQKSR